MGSPPGATGTSRARSGGMFPQQEPIAREEGVHSPPAGSSRMAAPACCRPRGATRPGTACIARGRDPTALGPPLAGRDPSLGAGLHPIGRGRGGVGPLVKIRA
eukprot:8604551-Pyramimonas_sp.AAC.1